MSGSLAPARFDAMLSVSRRVAAGDDLRATLDHTAREAARVVDARAASVLLLAPRGRMTIGGAWNVSDGYRRAYEHGPTRLRDDAGVTGPAVARRRSLVVADIQADPALSPWHARATEEGYRSMVATPLEVEGEAAGALNVYRSDPGPWPQPEVEMLAVFADHAATAIRIANLMDRQKRQLAGLSRVVQGLREQTHEHANRIHSLSWLLALGEPDDARRFLAELLDVHGQSHHAVVAGVEHPTLAGLLLAETVIANQRGITLKVDRRSRLVALPARIGEAEAVAILGHLLQQAFDAIAAADPGRRRVTFAASTRRGGVVLKARDWGERLPSLSHRALGDAVGGVHGWVETTPEEVGKTTVVVIPQVRGSPAGIGRTRAPGQRPVRPSRTAARRPAR